MKVLIVAPVDEEIGGVAYVIKNLGEYLRSRGHELVFLYPGSNTFAKKKTTSSGDIAFHLNLQAPFGNRHFLLSLIIFLVRFPIGLYQLIRIVRENGIQVINVHFPSDNGLYFALCRRLFSTTLVTSLHGADIFPNGRVLEKYSKSMRFLLGSSDKIVLPSRGYRSDVARLFPDLESKMISIHNGVNVAELQHPVETRVNGVSGSYILCIAMHNEKKGIDVLLHAFASISRRSPSLRLVLAGDGPLRPALEEIASDLGINDKVVFLGLVGRDGIAALLHGCELLVLPSRSEPFGIVLLEAMVCGKPIVATSVGGIPEIVQSGENGILVEPDNPIALAEAITTVLDNVVLRACLAKNGYSSVRERFCSENTGSSYEALLTTLIASTLSATSLGFPQL